MLKAAQFHKHVSIPSASKSPDDYVVSEESISVVKVTFGQLSLCLDPHAPSAQVLTGVGRLGSMSSS